MADRPRVLLVVPRYNCSFDNIATQLARRLGRFDCRTATMREIRAGERVDLAVALFWPDTTRLRALLGPSVRVLPCLYDHVSWVTPLLRQALVRVLRCAPGLVVGSPRLRAAMGALANAPGVPIYVCQDGVDLDLFPVQPRPRTFTAGWVGVPVVRDHDLKGIGIIREAAKLAGVPLVEQGVENPIPHGEMARRFYSRLSCYVCASESEGTPNPVLEALACGRPVVTTAVGIVEQVVLPGNTGLVVERSVEAIARAIREVATWGDRSTDYRRAVTPHSWAVAAEQWGEVLDAVLR